MELENPKQSKPCPRCGKTRTEGGGRLTQWISACNCVDPDVPFESVPPSTMCPTCGKRQGPGRSGSFTQWVFRQDLCSCHQADSNKIPDKHASNKSFQHSPKEELEEIELEVDPEIFPIQRYKPLSELGRGAAGTVYLCRDRLLGNKVAVKILNVLTPEQLVSFQNEARATSRLNHQSIVKILDFGATESGSPYMVMERFEGKSLESLLKERGTLDPTTVIMIFTKVAEGLAYAHERGVYHRDIKPSNLLLNLDEDEQPSVLIIDFGVAMLDSAKQQPTLVQGRTIVGSPRYMSPDQANGLAYDRRSEIYSLGCVMLEALAGRPPFDGETPLEILGKHANEVPPRLFDLIDKEGVPAFLDSLIDRTLSKDPKDRFQSMSDLSSELLAELTPQQQATRSGVYSSLAEHQSTRSGLYPSRSDGKSGKPVLLLVGSTALAAVVLLAISWQLLAPPKEAPGVRIKRAKKKTLDKITSRKFELAERNIVRASVNCTDDDIVDLSGKNVEALQLIDSKITDNGIRKLRDLNLPSLKSLDLARTSITDQCVDDINALSHLKSLRVSETKISNAFLKGLHLQLQSLDVDASKVGDEGFIALAKNIPQLYALEASATKITRRGIKSLSKMENLTFLYLGGLTIDDQVFDDLKNMPKLQSLTFTESKLSRKMLKRFPEMTRLSILGLSYTPEADKEMIQWLRTNMPRCTIRSQQDAAGSQMTQMSDMVDALGQ